MEWKGGGGREAVLVAELRFLQAIDCMDEARIRWRQEVDSKVWRRGKEGAKGTELRFMK